MTDAYYNALKKKRELQEELSKVEAFLEAYRHYDGIKTEQVGSSCDESSRGNHVDNSESSRRRVKPSELADIAERLIRAKGEPMTRGEIVTALEEHDVVLPGKDKPRYVGTILWRHGDRFVNVPRAGYAMRDMAEDKSPDVGRSKWEELIRRPR